MAEIHWLNPVDGKFTNKADWAGGAVPGSGDDAILDAGGARFTVAAAKTETVAGVQLTAYATLSVTAGVFTATAGTGAGANWGTIAIGDGAAFAMGGLVDNAGVIAVNSLGDVTRLIVAADTTLSGGGVVALSDYAESEVVVAAGTAVTLINKDDTIAGSGLIGVAKGGGALNLHNGAFGVIDADGNAASLVIAGGAGGGDLVNAGLVESAGGLYSRGCEIDNMTISGGGRLFAAYGTVLTLSDCTVSGQTFATAVGGRITVSGTGTITLGPKLVMAGSIDFAQASPIVLTRDLTLSGGGSVSMRNGVSGGAPLTLTNLDDEFGIGGAISGEITLINGAKGVIYVESALIIDTGANTIVNAGKIENGSAVTVASALDTSGMVVNDAGTLTLEGAVDNTGTLSVEGGTIVLAGAVTGDGAAEIHGGSRSAALDCAAAFSENVTFFGPHCTLELAQSQTYAGQVSGFADKSATTFDLRDIGFVGAGEASYSGTSASGVLTVTDGTHTAAIALIGDYVGWKFTAESDGRGGTLVLDFNKEAGATPPAQGLPSPHILIAAMAGLGRVAAAEAHPAEVGGVRAPLLARPHAMTA